MAPGHDNISAVAVAGGLLVVGSHAACAAAAELYDEESERLFTLPHNMVEGFAPSARRRNAGLVSVSAAALSAAP